MTLNELIKEQEQLLEFSIMKTIKQSFKQIKNLSIIISNFDKDKIQTKLDKLKKEMLEYEKEGKNPIEEIRKKYKADISDAHKAENDISESLLDIFNNSKVKTLTIMISTFMSSIPAYASEASDNFVVDLVYIIIKTLLNN